MPPARRDGAEQAVDVGGRRMLLRNLDKVLYPATGTTKGEVIAYTAGVADTILPHLADRPVTRMRWPDGVEGPMFVEKNMPRGAPDWVRTVTLDTPGSSTGREQIVFPLLDDLADLVWAANLAALELHVPQWSVGPRGGVRKPDRLVIDLDPGAPAGLSECAQVAHAVAERLGDDGLECYPVTSGSKGMQLYAPISARQDPDVVREYAKLLAESMERDSRLVISRMTRSLRPGKVLLDWSQNHHAKTTVSPYSMRGRGQPWVAAPRRWDELDDGLTQIGPDDVLARLQADGDLLLPLLQRGPKLPTSSS